MSCAIDPGERRSVAAVASVTSELISLPDEQRMQLKVFPDGEMFPLHFQLTEFDFRDWFHWW